MTSVGTYGYAWSSSSYAAAGTYANRAGNLNFNATWVNPLDYNNRANGFPVRCVQHLRPFYGPFPAGPKTALRPGVAEATASVRAVADSAIR